MRHWECARGVHVLRVEYEGLVATPSKVLQELLLAAGLGFEEQCLEFHMGVEITDTVSHDQVQRPLYNTSIDRSRAYSSQLNEFTSFLNKDSRTNQARCRNK